VTYVLLLLAIASELVGTSLLKATHGFSKLWPTLGSLFAYAVSLLLLAKAVERGLNVSIGYAIWSALGTTLIVLIGVTFLHQPVTLVQVGGIALVIVGVVILNLGGAH
jgi:small multidrug resistance pump